MGKDLGVGIFGVGLKTYPQDNMVLEQIRA